MVPLPSAIEEFHGPAEGDREDHLRLEKGALPVVEIRHCSAQLDHCKQQYRRDREQSDLPGDDREFAPQHHEQGSDGREHIRKLLNDQIKRIERAVGAGPSHRRGRRDVAKRVLRKASIGERSDAWPVQCVGGVDESRVFLG